MHSKNLIKHDNPVIFILWGLVLAKCLTLEYLIQVYSAPINSLFYIWALSLLMATAATLTFFRTSFDITGFRKTAPLLWIIVFSCAVVGFVMSLGIVFFTELNPYKIPAILSFLSGVAYLSRGILTGKHIYSLSGIGWWVGTATLATRNGPENLPIFAFLIILWGVAPSIIDLRRQQRAFL